MLQHYLLAPNCIGIEYVGNNHPKREDIPKFLAVFVSNDTRYQNLQGSKWLVTTEFVKEHFSRFERLAMQSPNQMLNLLEIAKHDRGYDPLDTRNPGWMLNPFDSVPSAAKFRFWADRPVDLVVEDRGCVKNIYELMYVPGSRWRAFGRFNHETDDVVRTWYQLDEQWMETFLKPQCVKVH